MLSFIRGIPATLGRAWGLRVPISSVSPSPPSPAGCEAKPPAFGAAKALQRCFWGGGGVGVILDLRILSQGKAASRHLARRSPSVLREQAGGFLLPRLKHSRVYIFPGNSIFWVGLFFFFNLPSNLIIFCLTLPKKNLFLEQNFKSLNGAGRNEPGRWVGGGTEEHTARGGAGTRRNGRPRYRFPPFFAPVIRLKLSFELRKPY